MSSQLNNNNNTHHRRDGGGGDFLSSNSSSRGGGGGGRKRLIDVFDAAEKVEASSDVVVSVAVTSKNKNDITPITTNKRLKVSVSSASSASSKSKTTTTTTTMKKPLDGVIACLSGLTNDQKTKFHSLIENLGGRYTRVFDLDKNTHLITDGPYGAKYELAAKSSSSNTNTQIHIVSPKWIIECSKNNQRIPEKEFIVGVVEENEAKECDENNNSIQNLNKAPPIPSQTHHRHHHHHHQQQQQLTTTVISQQIDGLLSSSSITNNSSSSCSLFECQNILLLGFDDDNNNDNEIKKKLSILVRRGLGTIYWEMNDVITIMVLSDNCNDDKLRKVVNLTTKQHPNLPQVVSPLWIIDCWKQNCLLLPSKYPPTPTRRRQRQRNIIIPKVEKEGGGGRDGKIMSTFPTTTTSLKGPSGGVLHKKEVHPSSQTSTTNATTTTATTDSTMILKTSSFSSKSSSKVFGDCLFTLVRIAPPNYAVDFDSQQQESFIKRHGGQLVTLKLLDALKQDYSTTTKNTKGRSSNNQKQQNKKRRRLCHVVCWGGGTTISTNNTNSSSRKQQQQQNQDWLLINPILSQIYRLDLCDIVFVTPFWLQTCVQIEKRIKPNRIPLIFIPQPYPIRKALLLSPLSNNNTRSTMTERKRNKTTTRTTTTTDINNINIAMTGFHWIERIAIINFINSIGGNFHENLNQQTTHLVCKTKATGIKLTKAKQWKIHIVSVDWLYHIAQYGFHGKGHGKGGGGGGGGRAGAGAGVAATKMTPKDDSESQLQQKSSTTTAKTTNEASNEKNDDCGGGDDATVGCELNFICV